MLRDKPVRRVCSSFPVQLCPFSPTAPKETAAIGAELNKKRCSPNLVIQLLKVSYFTYQGPSLPLRCWRLRLLPSFLPNRAGSPAPPSSLIRDFSLHASRLTASSNFPLKTAHANQTNLSIDHAAPLRRGSYVFVQVSDATAWLQYF